MKKSLSKRISRFLYHYFWDVDVKKLNPQKYLYFVINCLLDKGDIQAARFVLKTFPKLKLLRHLKN